jgi:hypothetical protein
MAENTQQVQVTISSVMAEQIAAHIVYERGEDGFGAQVNATPDAMRLIADLAGEDEGRTAFYSVLAAEDERGVASDLIAEIAQAFANLAMADENNNEIALTIAAAEMFTFVNAIATDGDGGAFWLFGERV